MVGEVRMWPMRIAVFGGQSKSGARKYDFGWAIVWERLMFERERGFDCRESLRL